MKNPFENWGSRKATYKKTEEKKEHLEESLSNTFPIRKQKNYLPGVYGFADRLGDNLGEALIVDIKKLPKQLFLAWRINVAGDKLERINEKDHGEAMKLNQEYESLLKETAQTGDDKKLKEFEIKKLGIQEEELEEGAVA